MLERIKEVLQQKEVVIGASFAMIGAIFTLLHPVFGGIIILLGIGVITLRLLKQVGLIDK